MKIFLSGKDTISFIVGVVVSFAFSMAVILSTLGIMDGFELALKRGLRFSSGDLVLKPRLREKTPSLEVKNLLEGEHIKEYAEYLQTEGFLVAGKISKGVMVRVIDPLSYGKVVKLPFVMGPGEVLLGKQLGKSLGVKKGDGVVLAMAREKEGPWKVSSLRRFVVGGFVDHKIYKKNARLAYLSRQDFQLEKGSGPLGGVITLNLAGSSWEPKKGTHAAHQIETFARYLEQRLDYAYKVRPYWSEYATLLKAVDVEKMTLGLVLQLLVVISIFNVLSFLFYLNEKKAKELFLLQSLGVGKGPMMRTWMILIFCIWIMACVVSLGMVAIFEHAVAHLAIFQLPGDVYGLSQLVFSLDSGEILQVFALALVWVFLMTGMSLLKMGRKSLLHGLRQEFS